MAKSWLAAGAGVALALGAPLPAPALAQAQAAPAAAMPRQAPAPAPAPAITIAGRGVFPESIAADRQGNIYVGSNPGIIYRAPAGSQIAEPWLVPDATNGLMSVFGVLADDARGLLWVCTNPPMGGSSEAAPRIKTFALADGAPMASFPLALEGPAMCNDMTIAADGAVYASEMLGGRILRLGEGEAAFQVWASDPALRSIDGISFAADGTLYANLIQRNTLLRIERDEAGRFAGARALQTSRPIETPDGLRPLPDGRMLQSEGNPGKITLLTMRPDGVVEVETLAQGIDYASAVAPFGAWAYYPEGKLGYLFDPALAGKDPGPFVIRAVRIPEAR